MAIPSGYLLWSHLLVSLTGLLSVVSLTVSSQLANFNSGNSKGVDRRKPGTSRFVTQRKESDEVEILSGVFDGRTTGTPIGLLIKNTDARSKDYENIKDKFRPGHADFAYQKKYGIRDYKGGGRSSARETAVRVAAEQLRRNG